MSQNNQSTGGIGRWISNAPESYPKASLDDLIAGAVDRYEEHIDVHGPGDDWKSCDPEDLRAKARENLVNPDGDDDYADALNYLLMARDARVEQELAKLDDFENGDRNA